MKNYYRVMLGQKSVYAQRCLSEGFIGIDSGIDEDLTNKLPDNWKSFNKIYVPIFLDKYPDKSKVSAGLACGSLWVVSKGIRIGDIVLCPDGTGVYHVGEVIGEYGYHKDDILPHRRAVRWLGHTVERSDMSLALKSSTGSGDATINLTKYGDEIESLIQGTQSPILITTDEAIEDPALFAMESHLEDFLVANWSQTQLGKKYDIFQENGIIAGKQYETEIGRIDILAISKDKKTILVIELKRGRTSDVVVGQILRYMGYVQEELADEGQVVKGAIIALEDDPKLRKALVMVSHIVDFYRYKINFELIKD